MPICVPIKYVRRQTPELKYNPNQPATLGGTGETMLRMASCQSDVFFFAKQSPKPLSGPIYITIDLMLIITPLKPNTRTTSRPILTCHLVENWGKRWDGYNFYSCVNNIDQIDSELFEKQTIKLLSWRIYTLRKGRYLDKQTTQLHFRLGPTPLM